MYHSIIFTDTNGSNSRNTYTNWHLFPDSRPVIAPPEPRTNLIDVPGVDGLVDLTSALYSTPRFKNREGSILFLVENGHNWIDVYTTVLTYLHGKRLRMYLEDDPNNYYEGRFSVESWESKNDGTGSTITIHYSVGPYKTNKNTGVQSL